jgi:hypothetical protein
VLADRSSERQHDVQDAPLLIGELRDPEVAAARRPRVVGRFALSARAFVFDMVTPLGASCNHESRRCLL